MCDRPLIAGFSGCTKSYFLVEPLRAPPGSRRMRSPAGSTSRHVAEVLLRLDDGVEIAAIGDIDGESRRAPDTRPSSPSRMQEGRHVGDAHLLDIVAVLDVSATRPGRPACRAAARPASAASPARARCAIVTVPMVPWPHIGRQPEVSMNRMAMSQSGARRRIEDRARHHVVAARLEHQPGADPVDTRRGNARASPSSWRPRAAGRRRRRGAPDCRRYGRRCRRRCGSPWAWSWLKLSSIHNSGVRLDALEPLRAERRKIDRGAAARRPGRRPAAAVAADCVRPKWPWPKA